MEIAEFINNMILTGFTTGLEIGFVFFFTNWIASTVFKLIDRTT